MKKVGLLLLTTIFFCCGDLSSEPDWSRYDSSLKSRIDKLDCTGLRKEFDMAEANSDRQRDRTGSDNKNLMTYIDAKMQEKSCY